jgi:predicted nucleotidyltransferase
MGKIFNYADIENHRVPTRDDFMTARSQALASLGKLARDGGIYGAKVFGSVANGTPSERSDFDLLVVTERADVLPALKSTFEAIHTNIRVVIDPIVIARDFAVRGFHSVDLFFLQHIQALPNEGNVAGYDPMEVMRPIDLPKTKIHELYLAQKVRRLREGVFAYSEVDRYRVLQRALEAPINVGRRTFIFTHWRFDECV